MAVEKAMAGGTAGGTRWREGNPWRLGFTHGGWRVSDGGWGVPTAVEG